MSFDFKKTLSTHLHNIRGWRTNRKIVVIESDDWGSLRMPSKAVYDKFLAAGYKVDKCPYNSFDNLESEDDLNALFEVLSKCRDKHGNPACFTPNYNVANPDFEKIAASGFNEYHYEAFTQSLERYYPGKPVMNIVKQGMAERMYIPQYHGREHINPVLWLEALKSGNEAVMAGFKEGVFGLSQVTSPLINKPYLATMIYRNAEELAVIERSIREGAELFKNIFGYTATSFIAPLYTWNPELEKPLASVGIKYIQGASFHRQYDAEKNNRSIERHAMGAASTAGQIYLARNCFLEPSLHKGADEASDCLKQISAAFLWKKPAVICSHRVNYIGSIVPQNRERNLKFLERTLSAILKKWPDVEFMSSNALGDIISKEK